MDRRSKTNIYAGNFILFIVLLLGVLINVAQYHVIGGGIASRKSPDLIDIGLYRGYGIRDRRHLYLNLAKFAPHVNMILPDKRYMGRIDIAQLYGLGRVSKVIHKNYNPKTFAADLDFAEYIVKTGKPVVNRGPGPFAIALGKDTPETIILLKRDGVWYLTDVSLLPSNTLEELSR